MPEAADLGLKTRRIWPKTADSIRGTRFDMPQPNAQDIRLDCEE
jgi:hypothetical protein